MTLRTKPFEEIADGIWAGKIGRLPIEIRRCSAGTYWRGPDNDVVVDRPRERYSIRIIGRLSSTACTLPGAFDAAERHCYVLQGHENRLERRLYAMDEDQATNERSAHEEFQRDAVEADRIAHSRGWATAIAACPDLRSFAERLGLYPFPEHAPSLR